MTLAIFYFNKSTKLDIASAIFNCCGQTASQLLHPIQALGFLSSGKALIAIGAINPPPVNTCSLYKANIFGMSIPFGQCAVQ